MLRCVSTTFHQQHLQVKNNWQLFLHSDME